MLSLHRKKLKHRVYYSSVQNNNKLRQEYLVEVVASGFSSRVFDATSKLEVIIIQSVILKEGICSTLLWFYGVTLPPFFQTDITPPSSPHTCDPMIYNSPPVDSFFFSFVLICCA